MNKTQIYSILSIIGYSVVITWLFGIGTSMLGIMGYVYFRIVENGLTNLEE